MSSPHSGRHEHGQNFLRDRAVIATIVDTVARTDGPIVEIGPGSGALTLPLQRLKRPLTAVEIDPGQAARLNARTSARTRVVTADFLRYRLPRAPYVVVGNLPFHLTTAILRRYQAMVHRVFTGRGRGVSQLVRGELPRHTARHWLRDNGIENSALTRHAEREVVLFNQLVPSGSIVHAI